MKRNWIYLFLSYVQNSPRLLLAGLAIVILWLSFPPLVLAEESSANNTAQTFSHSTLTTESGNQALLTTSWETVGGGRINRKYLNGLIAFCLDEERNFPNGATYAYATATSAAITGQVAAIVQRFGSSGVDNAQWWSQCQVAIWAVHAGCTTSESAAAFARRYCAERNITDPDTVADYAYIVGTLVEETSGQSGTAYLYQAEDPANQRILTYTAVWPDPAPSFPSPRYDQVPASANHTLERTFTISLQNKYAAVTREPVAGAIFQIYHEGELLGSMTTDANGASTFSWTITKESQAQVSIEYCSNYELLDPQTRKDITGYTNRDDAYQAAYTLALDQATQSVTEAISQPYSVVIQEVYVPAGFTLSSDGTQSITFSNTDSLSLSIENMPWHSELKIQKVDGMTGQQIPDHTMFALYEWNGSEYQLSPHYQVIRLEDGSYTVSSQYDRSQPGLLYYTQQNQGRFALAETVPPHGYLLEKEWFLFEISPETPVIYAHNNTPALYPIQNETLFANLPATGTLQIYKEGEFLTAIESTPSDNGDTPLSFVYTTGPVADVRFAIYAAEDIRLPGGSTELASYQDILLSEGTLVTTIVTDDTGWATLEHLPLGTYRLQEVEAGQGAFLLNPTVTEVTLSYADGNTPVVIHDTTRYHNARQTISISLIKQDRSTHHPLAHAVYGLYAAEDIYGFVIDPETMAVTASPTPLLAGHTLIETVTTNEQGTACFSADLPHGNYYVKELEAPSGYSRSEEVFSIDANVMDPHGDTTLTFSLSCLDDPIPPPPTTTSSSLGAATGDFRHPWFWLFCFLGSSIFLLKSSQKSLPWFK